MDLPGIGPWSAALILLCGLRRMDVFPQADTGAESTAVEAKRVLERIEPLALGRIAAVREPPPRLQQHHRS